MMDRSDEKRDDRAEDRADDGYNPLGIGNANPPRDRVQPDDEHGAGVENAPGSAHPGSRASIDMGAGGTGTEIERD
jgi:hypothetical protein